jgi:hypothetical protein
MPTVINGTTGITFTDTTVQNTAAINFRNRIINGNMVIDQRNGGASITPTTSGDWFGCDRWRFFINGASSKFSTQQSTVAPTGFINSTLITSLSAYSVASTDNLSINQMIEGLNISDLAWGTASAQTVTLSFWVRSSLTGTFGGSLRNSASDRSYPFPYTISAANTWEQKSVTIAGDTTGTWLTTNGVGIRVSFNIGSGSTFLGTANSWQAGNFLAPTGATSVVGTNGATLYITGVQLERGSTASSFDFRSYGQELALCQRYFCKTYDVDTAPGTVTATGGIFTIVTNASVMQITWTFPVNMRAAPTVTVYNMSTGAVGTWRDGGAVNNTITAVGQGQRQTSFQNFTASPGSSINGHAVAAIEL